MLHVQVHNYSPCNSASYSMFCVCDSYRQMHFQTASQAVEKEKINRGCCRGRTRAKTICPIAPTAHLTLISNTTDGNLSASACWFACICV